MSAIEERWEAGTEHDPHSVALYRAVAEIDCLNDDYFNFKCGGDGDNGEELMYILDVYFENLDKKSFVSPTSKGEP